MAKSSRTSSTPVIESLASSDRELDTLMPVALAALQEEDALLHNRFKSSKQHAAYATVSRGLGYWVYETTLVYTIFKSWIPIRRVVWDWRFPGNDKRRVDIYLVNRQKRVTHAFETKWCNVGARKSLRADAAKLRELGIKNSYLLAVWWNKLGELDADRLWVDEERKKLGSKAHFFGHFPTEIRVDGPHPPPAPLRPRAEKDSRHDARMRPKAAAPGARVGTGKHYFALAAFGVSVG